MIYQDKLLFKYLMHLKLKKSRNDIKKNRLPIDRNENWETSVEKKTQMIRNISLSKLLQTFLTIPNNLYWVEGIEIFVLSTTDNVQNIIAFLECMCYF